MSKLSDKFRTHSWAFIIIIFLLGALSFKLFSEFRASKELKLTAGKWDKLLLVLSQVDGNYVDTVNYSKVTEDAIPYVLQKLDPHSVYLTPQELTNADEQLQGNFDG
jgi:carboxyl-terminal processing protease